MPVTAKLSQLFYERLGEQVANELVDWFNQVDATYRADLRELNELNFARFDAKLEHRLAELHARLDAKMDRVAAEAAARDGAPRHGRDLEPVAYIFVGGVAGTPPVAPSCT